MLLIIIIPLQCTYCMLRAIVTFDLYKNAMSRAISHPHLTDVALLFPGVQSHPYFFNQSRRAPAQATPIPEHRLNHEYFPLNQLTFFNLNKCILKGNYITVLSRKLLSFLCRQDDHKINTTEINQCP